MPRQLTVLSTTIRVSINRIEIKDESLKYQINNPQSVLVGVQAKGMGLMSSAATTDLMCKI